RDQRQQGHDPLEVRDRQRAQLRAQMAAETAERERAAMTFLRVADEFIDNNAAGWTNRKHGQQWRNTLKTYAFPILGVVPVGEVTTDQ
ncbi:MAG TPA: hypothetical protein DD491_09025, partial [Halieaceae bacterium]|nr:hypothetical protein [Halieaceae bacterium]